MTLAVGVMSGTSLDGISAALVRLGDTAVELVAFRLDGGRVTGADHKVALTKSDKLPPYLVFGLDAAHA